MTGWLASPSVAGWMAFLGDIFGVVGVIVAVIGFALTLDQAKKAVTAARAAKTAALAAQEKIATFDVVTELKGASERLRDVQRHLKLASWESAIQGLLDVREAFTRVSNLPSTLNETQRKNIEDMLSELVQLSDELEIGASKAVVSIDVPKVLSIVRSYYDSATALSVVIKGAV